MSSYTDDVKVRDKNATQLEPAREDQVANHAGGFVFKLTPWKQLERFLVLGTTGGTYYTGQRDHTHENLDAIRHCIKEDGPTVVERVCQISERGRAPKNEPAILVLAMCLSYSQGASPICREDARKAVPRVCRIPPHAYQLAEYIQAFRGWGSAARGAIQSFFHDIETPRLAYYAIKYPQREGWTMRDLLRLSHYNPASVRRKLLMEYICGKDLPPVSELIEIGETEDRWSVLQQLYAAEVLIHTNLASRAAELILQHRLPREAVPTEFLNDPVVWEALLQDMPMTAMVRNLGKMSSIGLLKPLSKTETKVVDALTDFNRIRKARVHPLTLLTAWATYRQGEGLRGSLKWPVSAKVVDALEAAYLESFDGVKESGKRFYLALDVSGSMGGSMGGSSLSCAQGAACMAAATVAAEENTYVAGFTSGSGRQWSRGNTKMTPVNLTKRSGLTGGIVVNAFGATDCAKPMLDAMEKDLDVDVFVIYTDNETWAGDTHPYKALQQYRERRGIDAKLVVVGMTSTGFTIADPDDAGMLDVVGFDTTTPQAISAFAL